MTSLKTSIKTITYLSDIGCLEIQGASLLTPVTVPQKQTEKLTWNLKKGSTLRDGLTEWASSSPCGNSTWNLVWDTPVNYRIDAPLIFRGNFESALKDTLMLYLSADKPLYAFRNISRCVITIKDTQQE